ncbi:MAG: hypothetical protein U1A78_21650 [Polyangia bacterium]
MGLTPPQDQPDQPGADERGAGSDPGPAPPDPPEPPGPPGKLDRLDEPDLVRMLKLLRERHGRSRRCGVVCTHGLSPAEAARLCARLPRPPTVRRPLHPLLSSQPGPLARPQRLLVADYAQKDAAVATVGDWAAGLLPARLVASLEGALDELLLNALYDAPRGPLGTPRYRDLTPAQRAALPAVPGEHAEIRWAADKSRVVFAVRDRFGALRGTTVLDYLSRCAEAQLNRTSPLERKPSGSGIGLFLVATAATELLFRLRRSTLTEIVFSLARDRPRPLRALVLDEE